MSNAKRNRLLLIVFVVLTLVNLGAVATVLFKIDKKRPESDFREMDSTGTRWKGGPARLIEEFQFSEAQAETLRNSKDSLMVVIRPLMEMNRSLNQKIVDELMKENPDTALIRSYCFRVGENHAAMRFKTSLHLTDIKRISTLEQHEKLESFFREMIMRDEGGRNMGRMNRHRKGRNCE